MIKLTITEDGKQIHEFQNIKPKQFKTGKKGYYANGILVINGKAHRANILFIEVS